MASNTPVFLRNVPQYEAYLAGGAVPLPGYDLNNRGEIIIYHGEVFCRHPDCARGLEPLSATNNLRAHLRHHGYQVEASPTGRLSQLQKDRAIAWYRGLGGGTGGRATSVEEEEEAENDDEDNDEDNDDEEEEEEEEEEDDEDEYDNDDEDSDDDDDADADNDDEEEEEEETGVTITGMVVFFTIRR